MRPLSSSGLLPMPGAASSSASSSSSFSSWILPYRARFADILRSPDTRVFAAFWLFGLINNVLYVVILSAAQDLVGDVPKGVVLLAEVLPSFLTKLVAPYFIHRVPYAARVLAFVAISCAGMLLVALTPAADSVPVKLAGVVLSSLSSGGGELSFLSLTHHYGPISLAAWGSGTGGAGLMGAGLYVALTDGLGFSVRASLLVASLLPIFMLVSFFVVLPRGALRDGAWRKEGEEYEAVPRRDSQEEGGVVEEDEEEEEEEEEGEEEEESEGIEDGPSGGRRKNMTKTHTFLGQLRRARSLFLPYMLPLMLVYAAEYTINQGVAPTLLFPLDESPFAEFRSFYPFYGFLYQLGVFISRSSTPFVRVHNLYLPSLLQTGNLVLLTLHALLNFLPSVYLVFAVVFWEGLLGGAVYVNTYAEIMDRVPAGEREFSLAATSVSDSAGICVAGFAAMALEVRLCDWQVRHGRDYCRQIEIP